MTLTDDRKPSPTNRKTYLRGSLGRTGEDLAIDFYISLGYRLLARNWRAGRFAEVDLILRSPSGFLVFVEVKTRVVTKGSTEAVYSGFESVSWRKRKKIVTAARIFLSKQARSDIPCRFDVLVVSWDGPSGGISAGSHATAGIIHVPDAFCA